MDGEMDIGLLIDLVHSYPHIYDNSRNDFKDKAKKDNSWQEIGKLLKCPGVTCKAKWTSLRERYVREIKMMSQERSGCGGGKKTPWEYYISMSWLEPYIKRRRTKSNFQCRLGAVEEQSDRIVETQEMVDTDASQTSLSDFGHHLKPIEAVEFDFKEQEASDTQDDLRSASRLTFSTLAEETLTPSSASGVISVTPSSRVAERSTGGSYRKRKKNDDNLDKAIASSIQHIGHSVTHAIDILKGNQTPAEPETEDDHFGKTIIQFLKKQKECKAKNQLKKHIFCLLMDYDKETN